LDPLRDAVDRIRAGGLVAYPTETAYGLGADATSEAALARLRRWKGRSEAQPLSILVHGAAALAALGCEAGPRALALAAAFWPGPLTLVVPCRQRFARGVAREDGALGLRCSSHPLAAQLARRLSLAGVGPITATSLNPSGEPAARTLEEARALCTAASEESGPLLLEGPDGESGGAAPSTVVDLTGSRPRVLRWGALGPAELAPLLGGSAELAGACVAPGTASP
jgi:tRNA threonylcarbamoyl adenosine modification protein (Sua5/YciO/YrdC/YwlC family)